MPNSTQYRFNLGIPTLLSDWKAFFSPKYFSADLIAGITVAFVAIPLSLAIALASGVTPGAGLITAIIAGIVCAFFGGATLSVSGPAAAMSVLLADTVEKFGMQGLVFICLLAGLMQLLSGIIGIGRLARYVPLPVIAGFTAGIGAIIIIGQLPRAFGLQPPPESDTIAVFSHLAQYAHQVNFASLGLVVLTFIIIRGLPKIFPKVPAILAAVVIATAVAYFFHFNVELIGQIPRSLPAPTLPTLGNANLQDILLSAFSVFLLASLETLLSASAIDKLTGDKKHDSNQELIGQGLGNISVSLFGGIPVTSVIARSVTNVRAGAKTRRASIIHALIILCAVYAIAPLIGIIPVAALAGVLFSIGFSMINYWEFLNLWISSRAEAFIYAITFVTIIFVDLIAGVQAGMVAAGFIILLKASKTRLHVASLIYDNTIRLSISGALTFLSSSEIINLENIIEATKKGQIVILDLSNVDNLDSSGVNAIIELFNYCQNKKIKFYIKGLQRRFEPLFKVWGGAALLENNYLVSESDLREVAGNNTQSFRGRLIHGVQQFYNERSQHDKRLFDVIAAKQDPHTLFIGCSDSRINPNLITSTDPGELFIIRNVGNYIPPYELNNFYSEAAAIQFALNNLNISDIVICGHMSCGAMRAAKDIANTDKLPNKLKSWIELIRSQLTITPQDEADDLAKQNILNQLQNLKTFAEVQKKLADKSLTLHGWFFDFDQNLIFEWDEKTERFEKIMGNMRE
jgi:carbonic anhydrase